MSETRSALVAFGLCFAILFGFNYFFTQSNTSPKGIPTEQVSEQPQAATPMTDCNLSRGDALKLDPRVPIKNDNVAGSICLKGGRLDDLSLLKYKKTTESGSGPVELLSPDEQYAEVSWGDEEATWSLAKGEELAPGYPIELTWQNAEGLEFVRTISVDDEYMITVTDHVSNKTGADVKIAPHCRIAKTRSSGPSSSVHEGGIGYFDNDLEEIHSNKLKKGKRIDVSASDGWCGFTDKYWLTAFTIKRASKISIVEDGTLQQCHVSGAPMVVKNGETVEFTAQFFAGAKSLKCLDKYRATHSIKKFDLAVDFGWLYFITKPLFYLLQFIHSTVGNLAIAILILTILTKLALFPMASASQLSMMRMKNLQPKMEFLKQRYKDDKLKLQQEMLALYRKENVNPMSGLWPMLVQMPIFFCLYKVFSVNIEMRHAPLALWITDLSAPDPTSLFNLFGLIPWTVPSFLQIGVLPLLMCGTMVLQQRFSPQPSDPSQAKMMYFMPLIFLFLFSSFPAGLVLYWMISNILSIFQQLYISRTKQTLIK